MIRIFVIVAIIVNLLLIAIVLLFNLTANQAKIINCTIGILAFLIAMGSVSLVDDYGIAGVSATFWSIVTIVTLIRATCSRTDD